jgi:acetyl esterase/lipase
MSLERNWLQAIQRQSEKSLLRLRRAPLDLINTVASSKNFKLYKNLEYGLLERQKLDLYLPRRLHHAPLVIFVHGGYWHGGSKDEYAFLAEAFNLEGFAVATVNYRLAPGATFPTWIRDVGLAVRWLRRHADQYGFEAEKVSLIGHSSGAHITSLMALDERHLRDVGLTRDVLSAVVCMAGPYDFFDFILTDAKTQAAFGDPLHWSDTQPVRFADGTNPPMLLLHGEKDTLVNPLNTPALEKALQKSGGQVKAVMFEKLDHFTMLGAFSKIGRWLEPAVLPVVSDFLRQHTNQ